MLLRKRADIIRKILRTRYPHVKTQLGHRNAFELLIATILSAQCTDVQVNRVTPKLFEKFSTPADFANAPRQAIEASIHSTGFYRNKAKNIQNCCKALIENYQGRVPDRLEALTTLPGVGRKTANVVLGAVFGIPGMVVDTHVARISQRLAFTKNKDAVKIEFDLMGIIPKSAWNDFSLHLIYFGREICSARRPLCKTCPVSRYCPYPEK
jgi:endonuclease-3